MGETRFNTRMARASRICNTLDETADMLALSDGENWAAWLSHLLQVLEAKTLDAARYEEFLKSLQKTIAARLERGRW